LTLACSFSTSIDDVLLSKLNLADPLVDLSQRFAQAAEAIRHAIEKLPPKVLAGSSIEVKDRRYSAAQIRALYESERYPLSRNKPSL
jgi:hypothetical protein